MTQEIEDKILEVLARTVASSGRTNADIAWRIGRQPGMGTPRQHAAFVKGILLSMEKRGLIKRMDDEKPIVWQIARSPE